MFSRKKKRPEISLPSNFEHRVHTGFDKKEGKYIGLPLQWQSVVRNNQTFKSSNRPVPVSVNYIKISSQCLMFLFFFTFLVRGSLSYYAHRNSRFENNRTSPIIAQQR